MKILYRDRVKHQPKKETAFTGHTVYKKCSIALPKRADSVAKHLEFFNTVFGTLFSDEHFVTLLRAESMTTVPGYLELLLDKG